MRSDSDSFSGHVVLDPPVVRFGGRPPWNFGRFRFSDFGRARCAVAQEFHGRPPAPCNFVYLAEALRVGIETFLDPEDVRARHCASDFRATRYVADDLRDHRSHARLPGHVGDREDALGRSDREVGAGRPFVQGELDSRAGLQEPLLHGLAAGRSRLEIGQLRDAAQGHRGVLQADVFQIDDEVVSPGIVHLPAVHEVDPRAYVAVYVLDELLGLLPAELEALHDGFQSLPRLRDDPDPHDVGHPWKKVVAGPPVIDEIAPGGLFADRVRGHGQVAVPEPGHAFLNGRLLDHGDFELAHRNAALVGPGDHVIPAQVVVPELLGEHPGEPLAASERQPADKDDRHIPPRLIIPVHPAAPPAVTLVR